MNWDLAVTLEGSYVSSMEYDALNRARNVTYPQDVDGQRKTLIPTYNKGGALTRVDLKDTALSSPVNYVDRIVYNAKGQQLLVAYGNGIMTRFLYRSDNFRLLRLKSEKYTKSGLTYTSNSGIKQNYSYEYDLSGNIININDTTTDCGYGATPNALSRNFIYDALYRLLSATGRETAPIGTTPWNDLYRPENESLARGYTQQYSYDKLGNIQELQHIATGGNFTRTFNYHDPFANNQLVSIGIGSNTYNFSHDVNGNMLSEGDTARHMEYDCADRLRAFFVKTGTAEPSKYTHYLYDGTGNRVKKITRRQGGKYTATTYIDGAFEYTKESTGFDGIPNLTIGTWTIGSYSSGGEQNILHIMGGATRRIGAALGDSTPAVKYNLEDHLGSSCVQLDTNGTTVSLEEYYPFGETSFGSYAKKRYRFCGKEKDEESGLYYYGMRYYSPWTCRFINVDPLAGKYPFYTPYQYAGNKPINFIDLDGGEEKPNPTTNSGNTTTSGSTSDNLVSYPDLGGGTVNLPMGTKPNTAPEGSSGTLTGGATIPFPTGSVINFEVNGVNYHPVFERANQNEPWQFVEYRDPKGKSYPNPEIPASVSTSGDNPDTLTAKESNVFGNIEQYLQDANSNVIGQFNPLNIVGAAAYNSLDEAYVVYTKILSDFGLVWGPHHLNGNGTEGDEVAEAGVTTTSNIFFGAGGAAESATSSRLALYNNVTAETVITNSKGIPYPNITVDGYGKVPFPNGPFTPNNSQLLRNEFTPKLKADFKQWWLEQGRPWPNVPEGSSLNIHHIKPLGHGGTNVFENLVPLIQPEQHQPFTNWWRGY